MDRRQFLIGAGAAAVSANLSAQQAAAQESRAMGCIMAAYYFGNFHVDPRNEAAHGPGWTEWNLVKAATPKFEGHRQPHTPVWGYEDESDPRVFEKKIASAHAHGLDAMIFDWYWYDGKPFLNGALERGYLQAANRQDVKFAIMWANHDWYDIHPAKLGAAPQLQFAGAVSKAVFEELSETLLNYFENPCYLKIDGQPYFSIYELYRFIQGMGGVREAADAIAELRRKARARGLPGVHVNAVTWGVKLLPGQSEATDFASLLHALEVDSTTSYVWIHHTRFSEGMTTEYADIRRQYEAYRDKAAAQYGREYFPNVTVGWDSSPRACQTDNYRVGSYPFTSVVVNNTPEQFREALASARKYAVEHLPAGKRLITINSWNEWTEGSYLEPDDQHGERYLEQLRQVFKNPA